MTEFTKGDILKADVEALVNTVNCVGIMGRGIALQFRMAYPRNYKNYQAACLRGEVQPGRMFVFETGQLTNPRYIINFPTKRHWRGRSRLEDIKSGLDALVDEIKKRDIKSIALPPLGSGLGGMDWNTVKPLIARALRRVPDVMAVVFEPGTAPSTTKSRKVPTMTVGRAALVGLVNKYLAGLLDPSLSLLELHKLMYFMQEAGQQLRLRYVEAPYGPYSENLRQVLIATEGYYTSGYGDGGDVPTKLIQLVPGSIEDAEHVLSEHPSSLERFEKVGRLVEGFETSHGLELLATVHWVATKKGAESLNDIIRSTYAWGPRKCQFSEGQIEIAWKRLRDEGWLPVPRSA